MISLTALILTRNEEANIQSTLRALQWIENIVIIDSFSSDETIRLAQASHPSVRIFQREFDTHATQWNFGLQQIETEWVLTLDADYEVSAELTEEIKQLDPPEDIAGYQAR